MNKNKEIKMACITAIIKDNKRYNGPKAYMLGELALAIDSSFQAGEVSGKALLDTIGDTLSPTQRGILLLRYNLALQHTGTRLQSYVSIGEFFKLSNVRIHQIEAEALMILRQPANISRFSLREKDLKVRERIQNKDSSLDIKCLGFNRRLYYSLSFAGIEKIADLKHMSNEDLLKIRNIGPKSIDEIRNKLEAFE